MNIGFRHLRFTVRLAWFSARQPETGASNSRLAGDRNSRGAPVCRENPMTRCGRTRRLAEHQLRARSR